MTGSVESTLVYPIPIRNVKDLSGLDPENQTEDTKPLFYLDVLLAEAKGWTPKGGDPATGSPTATLLRLHISHSTYSNILNKQRQKKTY